MEGKLGFHYLEICFLKSFFFFSSSIRWFGIRSTSPAPRTSTDLQQRRKPLREMTLPNLTQPGSKEGSLNESDGVLQQPVSVPPRLGVLGWFGSSSSINSGTGSVGSADEPKTQTEKVTAERSEPAPVPNKEEELLKIESREKELEEKKLGIDQREREVESREKVLEEREQGIDQKEKESEERKIGIDQREKELDERQTGIDQREKESEERQTGIDQREKELEERTLAIDQREKEVNDRSRGLDDRERKAQEDQVELQRKIEEVERQQRELDERREEFEKEREKWLEESNGNPSMTEWKAAMEALQKEMNLEISFERRKAEERELELETRVMKKVTELLAQDKDEQKRKKRWDVIKPLTR